MEQVSVYYNNNHSPNLPSDIGTSQATQSNRRKSKTIDPEIFTFMKTLLDEFTHLGSFPSPKDTNLVISVTAMKDAYVPVKGYTGLDELWPGIETRYLNAGHISSFLFQQHAFK
jgi:hypothetical protein